MFHPVLQPRNLEPTSSPLAMLLWWLGLSTIPICQKQKLKKHKTRLEPSWFVSMFRSSETAKYYTYIRASLVLHVSRRNIDDKIALLWCVSLDIWAWKEESSLKSMTAIASSPRSSLPTSENWSFLKSLLLGGATLESLAAMSNSMVAKQARFSQPRREMGNKSSFLFLGIARIPASLVGRIATIFIVNCFSELASRSRSTESWEFW